MWESHPTGHRRLGAFQLFYINIKKESFAGGGEESKAKEHRSNTPPREPSLYGGL